MNKKTKNNIKWEWVVLYILLVPVSLIVAFMGGLLIIKECYKGMYYHLHKIPYKENFSMTMFKRTDN